MAKFQYRGLTTAGTQQRGEIEALNEDAALEALRSRRITPIEIVPIREAFDVNSLLTRTKRVPTTELVIFTRQLATLIDAGVSVVNAMGMLEDQLESDTLKEILREMADKIETGSSLSEAFADYPDTFSPLFSAMIRAGEESGTLDESLRQLSVQLERENRLKKQVKAATRYPTVVLAVAALVVIVVMLFVVPSFKDMFAELGGELPAPTRALVAFSQLLLPVDGGLIPIVAFTALGLVVAGFFLTMGFYRLGWLPLGAASLAGLLVTLTSLLALFTIQYDPNLLVSPQFLSLPGAVDYSIFAADHDLPGSVGSASAMIAFLVRMAMFAAFFFIARKMWKSFLRTPEGRRAWDRFRLNAPVRIGSVVQKVAVARFCRTLSTLTRAGVPVLTAFDIVKTTAGNVLIEEAVDRARVRLASGSTMAEPLAEANVFPPMVTRMIAIGEQTGQLDNMLLKAAEYYEEEVDISLRNISAIIEPIMIVLVAIVVALILVSLYLPVFSAYTLMSQ